MFAGASILALALGSKWRVGYWTNRRHNDGGTVPIIDQILELKSPVATDETKVDIFSVIAVDFHDHVEVIKPGLFAEEEERANWLRGFNMAYFGKESNFGVMSDAGNETFVVDDVNGDNAVSLGSFYVSW